MTARKLTTLMLGALALVAPACRSGDSESALAERIELAATRTEDARSGRVSFHATMTGLGAGSRVGFRGDGVFDYRNRRGRLQVAFSGLGAPPAGPGEMTVIQDGTVVYVTGSQLSRFLPGDARWLKMDLDAIGRGSGIDVAALSQLGQSDPAQTLHYLRGVSGDVDELGTEEVRGVKTTRYRATIDLEKAAARAPEAVRARVKESIRLIKEQLGNIKIPTQVWIDDDGLPRRIRTTYAYGQPADKRSSPLTQTFTMELFDFGVPVDVEAPPPGKVTDLAKLLGKAGTRPG